MGRFVSASSMLLVGAVMVMLIGCGEGTDGDPKYSGVEVKKEPGELPKCKEDELPVVYYVVSTDEFVYCDGVEYIVLADLAWPEDGISWIVEATPAGAAACPAGGATINAGPDADGDGIMDEVTSSQTVCNGVDGADGADGQDGIGWVVETETIPTSGGPPCPAGGVIINVGPDADWDGRIDGEPTSVETICHGTDGQDGADGIGWAVETETLPALGEPPCPAGGVTITAGPDADRDGQIDDEPPPFSDTICNGTTGVGCTVVDNENGTYNITCGDSTVTVSDPACTVDDNGDGTKTIRCNDGTQTTVTDVQECGDGVVHYPEECDDGNLEERDGCSPVCVIEYSTCGDGWVAWDEECDDGNTTGGDGCSADCLYEFLIAYHSFDADELFTNIVSGAAQGLVASMSYSSNWAWSPDGTRIAYVAEAVVEPPSNDCSVIPASVIGVNDGCDCAADGSLDCDSDCTIYGNLGGRWCGCQYCYGAASTADELFTNTPDGSDARQISAGLANSYGEWEQAWSPDGTRLAYIADQDTDGTNELYTSASDGSDNFKVNGALAAGGNVTEFAWSPDGARLAYVADQDTDGVAELYAGRWDGSANYKMNGPLTTGGQIVEWAWSPDGDLIAYRADQDTDGTDELYTSSWDGSSKHKVNAPVPSGDDVSAFAWSPSGDMIAYTLRAAHELFTSTPSGATLQFVALVSYDDSNWGWSPDGSRVAYIGEIAVPPSNDCSVIPAQYIGAGDGCDCAADGSLDCDPDCTIDGNPGGGWCDCQYCYGAGSTDDELFTSTPDGSDSRQVSAGLVVDVYGPTNWAWSPDATRLAYLASQTALDPYELYTSRWDGTETYEISVSFLADREGVARFEWSPNGSRVAYLGDQSERLVDELFSSTWDGSQKDKISGPGVDVRDFEWSASGDRIAYRTNAPFGSGGYDTLYTAAPNGTDVWQVSDLPDDDVRDYAWSPAPNR